MSNPFFDQPILNSPYEKPIRHWQLDETGQPTQQIVNSRRKAEFITPIPESKQTKKDKTKQFVFDEGQGLSTDEQQYETMSNINLVRGYIDQWRALPKSQWQVTPETARLLEHWRTFKFSSYRPFFCQLEAVETLIWLTEVAPQSQHGKRVPAYIAKANDDANPELLRTALKLATGAGKTTVMAMIISWQTINAVRRPASNKFTRGFLVVTPGITIKDRLRVLLPNDPDSYYVSRELVPPDMIDDLKKAKIVITNYHAFKLRETMELSKGGRSLLEGGHGPKIETLETEGQMLHRVIPELMNVKNLMVINDEAHHCYREKPGNRTDDNFKGDDKKEAEANSEAARLWISGIEAIKRKIGLSRVVDLSATPFFLKGSGYREGTLFPWTVCDFSLMDAIECGIVKLPRVPVAENILGHEMPTFRDLWENIRKDMPKKGRGKAEGLDPLALPTKLQTALTALYGHYAKVFKLWENAAIDVPPCFIIVCNNTSTSKLVYDYISGFERKMPDGSTRIENGRLELFRNYDSNEQPLAMPRTLLIDSEQLESGEALDESFRDVAKSEIERFKRELVERTGNRQSADNLTDQDILREVMNTVGKTGRLGANIRCVVSVSMLSEGWDASTVTHVLGVRAFGTQLLCEQVIGRALRRQSYDLNENGLFDVEYADVLGIPFDFNAKPVVAPPPPPPPLKTHIKAVRPDRDHLEILFPRVEGYRVEPATEDLTAAFTPDSKFVLTPDEVGPTVTTNQGIIGEAVNLTLEHIKDLRPSTVVFHVAQHLLYTRWRDPNEQVKMSLFGPLRRIVKQWLDDYLVCVGGTYPGLLLYQDLCDEACNRINAAITRSMIDHNPVKVLLDPYNSVGSTSYVSFFTTKANLWTTDSRRCPINYAVLDSDWEAEFCRVAENHPRVFAYVKNHNMGFEIPYRRGSERHKYVPDYIVLIDDGHGADDPLHLIVEIKGYRGEDAKDKKDTTETYWLPGVNRLKTFGRWAFAEFTEVYAMETDFAEKVKENFDKMLGETTSIAK